MSLESQRIAAAVGKAAAAVLEPLENVSAFIGIHAARAGDEPGPIDDLLDCFSEREKTYETASELGRVLDPLCGWWAADRPPEFDPRATSVAEAVYRNAFATIRAFEAVGKDLWAIARFRFVELFRPGLDFQNVKAALLCEVATMSRREPPDEASMRRLTGEDGWWPDLEDIDQSLWENALGELPSGWSKLAPAARSSFINEKWRAAGRAIAKAAATPPALLPLTAADDCILEALDGKSLTAYRLANKTGFSLRHIVRRIVKNLEPIGLVKNLPNNGYYRPDRPPPNFGRPPNVTK